MKVKSIMELLEEEKALVQSLNQTSKKTEITNLKAAIRMKRLQIAKALSPLHNYGIDPDLIEE